MTKSEAKAIVELLGPNTGKIKNAWRAHGKANGSRIPEERSGKRTTRNFTKWSNSCC